MDHIGVRHNVVSAQWIMRGMRLEWTRDNTGVRSEVVYIQLIMDW